MQGGRFDWLAELGGATALAAAGAFAAFKAAPSFAIPPATGLVAGGFGFLAIGLAGMKVVGAGPRRHQLPDIELPPLEAEPAELLLDTPCEEPLLLVDAIEPQDDALLLEDALPSAPEDSRVVQLFAHPAMPTPGQLKDRIDRHLAGAPCSPDVHELRPARPDASAALFAALDELKRSLR